MGGQSAHTADAAPLPYADMTPLGYGRSSGQALGQEAGKRQDVQGSACQLTCLGLPR